jgi:dCMP deaminase
MRPSRDQWGLQLAQVTAQRATCCRRQVGCVLVNERGHVLATGYNGRAAGLPHCNEVVTSVDLAGAQWKPEDIIVTYPHACAGATAPSGTNLDGCEAIHAEQNALLQCRDVHQIHTAYVTASPCITCVKLLLNTSVERVVFATEYSHVEARGLWERGRRGLGTWLHMPLS